jgi:hypothetical protein
MAKECRPVKFCRRFPENKSRRFPEKELGRAFQKVGGK